MHEHAGEASWYAIDENDGVSVARCDCDAVGCMSILCTPATVPQCVLQDIGEGRGADEQDLVPLPPGPRDRSKAGISAVMLVMLCPGQN